MEEGFRKVGETGRQTLRRGTKLVREFRTFVLRGSAVDLAVGVVIGAAFNEVVQLLVKNILTPLVSIPGKVNFASYSFSIRGHGFKYGEVVNAVISLLLVAVAVFFFVVRPMNKLRERRKAGEPEPETTRDCPECLSKIPAAAKRCAFCTSTVAA